MILSQDSLGFCNFFVHDPRFFFDLDEFFLEVIHLLLILLLCVEIFDVFLVFVFDSEQSFFFLIKLS
jgi:hypothetical protein